MIVEDNPADVFMLRIALEDSKVPVELEVISDGEQAMAMATGGPAGPACPQPDVILLDLNFPGFDGKEVLKALRANPLYQDTKVLILTSSDDLRDRRSCEVAGADMYLQKPRNLEELESLGRMVVSMLGDAAAALTPPSRPSAMPRPSR
ncbi:MAG TPA: response regulator [Candidatus Polarisedimenticolia bacterium]|nr:response regulator [Candidatus Polarisedimenticolia bacterium]